ncbi:MAG TPA: hypothetical protein VKB58_04465 [Terriglobales bacterium]|jgi:hypothetical protein|nr:hypothetical protein [Terriglobales bacterium]
MKRWLRLLLFFLPALSLAQQPVPAPAASLPAQASIEFSFDWPQGIPWQSYSITTDSEGKTHFSGIPHPDESNDTDSVQQDFTMSEANRQKIFELAQKLDYFQRDYDSHLKHVAFTGKKTLQYKSPQLSGSTSYNYTQNADVDELTRIFLAIATTIDFGRKLAFQYRFDKLGMSQRLTELDEMYTGHRAEELSIIAPILRKIANDPNMMNISQQTARRLLHNINQPVSAAQTPGSQ